MRGERRTGSCISSTAIRGFGSRGEGEDGGRGRVRKGATLWSPPPAPRRSNAPSRGGRDRGQEERLAGGRQDCPRKWSLTGQPGTNPSQTLRLSLSSVGVLSDSLVAHTEEVSLTDVTSDSRGWWKDEI